MFGRKKHLNHTTLVLFGNLTSIKDSNLLPSIKENVNKKRQKSNQISPPNMSMEHNVLEPHGLQFLHRLHHCTEERCIIVWLVCTSAPRSWCFAEPKARDMRRICSWCQIVEVKVRKESAFVGNLWQPFGRHLEKAQCLGRPAGRFQIYEHLAPATF